MDQALTPRPVRIVLTGVALIVFTLYVWVVCSLWRADWLQDHYDQRSLEASVERAPWSAENHRLLGLFFLNVAQDSRRAIESLNHAVELDPYDARYWLDLADAYEVQGAEAVEVWVGHVDNVDELTW